MYYPGYEASYWSRSSNASDYAFYLDFAGTGVSPSSGTTRYTGRSLRCLYAI